MTGPRETAIGVATVLQAPPKPDPLPVDFRGYSAEHAIYLLKAFIDECVDRDVALAEAHFDASLSATMTNALSTTYRGVLLRPSEVLWERMQFFRTGSPTAEDS